MITALAGTTIKEDNFLRGIIPISITKWDNRPYFSRVQMLVMQHLAVAWVLGLQDVQVLVEDTVRQAHGISHSF